MFSSRPRGELRLNSRMQDVRGRILIAQRRRKDTTIAKCLRTIKALLRYLLRMLTMYAQAPFTPRNAVNASHYESSPRQPRRARRTWPMHATHRFIDSGCTTSLFPREGDHASGRTLDESWHLPLDLSYSRWDTDIRGNDDYDPLGVLLLQHGLIYNRSSAHEQARNCIAKTLVNRISMGIRNAGRVTRHSGVRGMQGQLRDPHLPERRS